MGPQGWQDWAMSKALVNVDDFARAESNRMFATFAADAGGVNQWLHFRMPTPLDKQPVIRMNRDTLYSAAVVDATKGVTVVIPETGSRYVSLMVVNQDHYVQTVLHDAGEHHLSSEEIGTDFVALAIRTLVDPADPDDVVCVNDLQDQFKLSAGSAQPFEMPDYDEPSFTETRKALLALGKGTMGFSDAFGTRDEVNPIHHLIATAAGWGGLPVTEAYYVNVEPGLPIGDYELTVRDVPVDAFWSISVYNADGYFEPNDRNANSINSITARPNDEGSITVHFGSADRPNSLPITEGWNYLVRLYRPRPEILNETWTFPTISN
jgi:hypothetical protein